MQASTATLKPFSVRFSEQVREFFQPYITEEVKATPRREYNTSLENVRDILEETKLKQQLWNNLHVLLGWNVFKTYSESCALEVSRLTEQFKAQQNR
ncbi:hypothetical protein [Thioflexithrix psekupsensis]|uniref:Uncharacterized protein n=1 Tax=Thioflexithrix psekupsensis TaxID=1570016 RepID=A0A251X435_9GAMM|nr:hypothetical protein [Thioflexithrix psekupsensis]OUD12254.1 hypothetical protein TPSD3_14130 [Thioflexithrix psekupsensis]